MLCGELPWWEAYHFTQLCASGQHNIGGSTDFGGKIFFAQRLKAWIAAIHWKASMKKEKNEQLRIRIFTKHSEHITNVSNIVDKKRGKYGVKDRYFLSKKGESFWGQIGELSVKGGDSQFCQFFFTTCGGEGLWQKLHFVSSFLQGYPRRSNTRPHTTKYAK